VKFWVGITDRSWFGFLAGIAPVDEINFWVPSGRKPVDLVGSPFLFKLHAPDGGFIVGGGHYAHFTRLPVRMAWDAFTVKNGAATFDEFATVLRARRPGLDMVADQIGCVAIVEPFFLPRELWIQPPADWPGPVQLGKTYDTTTAIGADLWERVQLALAAFPSTIGSAVREPSYDVDRYGEPMLVKPRLGQGTFHAKIVDAYERRCVVTNERTLPVLQAAHIKPYALSGPHAPENGLLLRSDVHTLFDAGYVTITPELEFRVGTRIRAEFENGRDYYALDRRPVRLPARGNPPPAREYLEWHADTVFRG
jgi:putative restriction endonuclease